MRIRRTNDYQTVINLHWKIFPTDSINDMFSEEGSWFWLIWDDKKPVGFASITQVDDEIMFFSRSGILPSHRGQGLQKRLIRVRENFCRKYDYKTIITYTLLNNPASANNLFSMGFKLYVPEYQYIDGNVNYFIKELD